MECFCCLKLGSQHMKDHMSHLASTGSGIGTNPIQHITSETASFDVMRCEVYCQPGLSGTFTQECEGCNWYYRICIS